MRVVVAIDSFKGSLSSLQAGSAVKEAIFKTNPDAEVFVRPVADGGEGTVEALATGLGGELVCISVTGPLFKPVNATYCIIENKTAVIEMASAGGITLISPEERNPLETTTYGVGEMVKDAIKRGCRHFIIGIGGSATNDGGIGMLGALGFTFLDAKGNSVPLCAKGLQHLSSISTQNVIPELGECTFRIACDVTNPLCGSNGCSHVYGPQKGASPKMIALMDNWLEHYAQIAKSVTEKADRSYPGTGAAGGLGFAFYAFTNAVLESGINIILDETKLEDFVKESDIVVTGEGRLDSQTIMGKTPIGVAKLAKKYGKKVIAFSGSVTEDAEVCNEHGIDAFFPIVRGVTTLADALNEKNAYNNLVSAAYQVFRLVNFFSHHM